MATDPEFNAFVTCVGNIHDVFNSNGADVTKLWDGELDARRYILLRFELNSGYNFLLVATPINGSAVTLGIEGEGGVMEFNEQCSDVDMVNVLKIVQAHRRETSMFR